MQYLPFYLHFLNLPCIMSAKILIIVLAYVLLNLKKKSAVIGFRMIYCLTICYFKLCEQGMNENKYMTGLFDKTYLKGLEYFCLGFTSTGWKKFKYKVFSGPYFFCIWIEYCDLLCRFPYSVRIRNLQTRNNSVFGHFSHS